MVATHKPVWLDTGRIDIKDETDLVFWTERLCVSPTMLRQAIRIVGSQLRDVSCFLHSRRLPDPSRF